MPTLAEHYQSMALWNGCALSKESNFVPGHGNHNAAIVFIGEAPGKKEDETGIPFLLRTPLSTAHPIIVTLASKRSSSVYLGYCKN